MTRLYICIIFLLSYCSCNKDNSSINPSKEIRESIDAIEFNDSIHVTKTIADTLFFETINISSGKFSPYYVRAFTNNQLFKNKIIKCNISNKSEYNLIFKYNSANKELIELEELQSPLYDDYCLNKELSFFFKYLPTSKKTNFIAKDFMYYCYDGGFKRDYRIKIIISN